MHTMVIQISEIRENERLNLEFDLGTDLLSEVLIDSDYSCEHIKALTSIDRVGQSGSFRVLTKLDMNVDFVCGRCMEDRSERFAGDSEFVLMPKSDLVVHVAHEEVELGAEDLDVMPYEGDAIDLRPLFREAILEILPVHALCSHAFQEACEESFEKNIGTAVAAELEEAQVDLRWGPLLELKKKQQNKD